MSTRLERIQNAVEKTHDCNAVHEGSFPVREEYQGKVVWEGVVESFNVNHPRAKRCYSWEIPGPHPEWVAVLESPPVVDPVTAVRAYVVSRRKTIGA